MSKKITNKIKISYSPGNSRWDVLDTTSKRRLVNNFQVKKRAIEFGKEYAKSRNPSKLLIEKRSGSAQKKHSYNKKYSNSTIEDFRNRVIEGDCLDVLPLMPDNSVDFILTDLPYGTTQNNWDSLIPMDELWEQYERVLKDDGVIAMTSQHLFTARLIMSKKDLFKYKITWIKSKATNFLNAKKQPLRKHEDICVFYKNQPTYNPQMSKGESYDKGHRKKQLTGSYGNFKSSRVKSDGERYPTDVVYFKTAETEGEVYHSTQKPVSLGRYLIRTFSDPGDVVLDNACGSGSFLVAAKEEGRDFVGIELNEDVYLHKEKEVDLIEVCLKRLCEAQKEDPQLT